MAKRLALVAGVDESQVTIDRGRKRAFVRARVLEGATLLTYKALEARIGATDPDWIVELLPPAGPLPVVGYDTISEPGSEPAQVLSPGGIAARDLTVWAAQRLGLPIVVSGPVALVEDFETQLKAAGIMDVRRGEVSRGGMQVTVSWGEVE